MRSEKRLNLHGSVAGAWSLQLADITSRAVLTELDAHVCIHVSVSQDNHRSWSRGSHALPVPQSKEGEA
jgi:hypothetical protein